MRREVLLRSVKRLLEADETLREAAFMWSRHRLSTLYAVGALIALLIVAALAGFEQWPTRVAIGVAGAAVAVSATTEYRVLALTGEGLVLLGAGRVRHVAKSILKRLPNATKVEIVRDTLITTDWRVGSVEYTVPKASQRAMERIAAKTG